MTRVLQRLEASRNASRFSDTIEYVIFTRKSEKKLEKRMVIHGGRGGKETVIPQRTATGGTQTETSSKKLEKTHRRRGKTLPPSKVDKTRKIALRHVEGRGVSKKKNRG